MNDLSALEPEQRSDALEIPLAKMSLNRQTTLLFWFLRAYVAVSIVIVIVAFARSLR